MKHSLCLAIVALAVSAALVHALDCTPTTCDGPTQISFNTPNCTGEPVHFSQRTGGVSSLDACIQEDDWYIKASCSASGFRRDRFSDNQCTEFTSSEMATPGLCVTSSGGSSSSAYVCNVNDTIALAGVADVSLPTWYIRNSDCPGPNNCPGMNYYFTYYTEAQCQSNTSRSFGYHGFSWDTCYLSGVNNIVATCTDDSIIMTYYQSGGCSGTPISSTTLNRHCSRYAYSLSATESSTITCSGVQQPSASGSPGSPTPTSSATLTMIPTALLAFAMASTLALLL